MVPCERATKQEGEGEGSDPTGEREKITLASRKKKDEEEEEEGGRKNFLYPSACLGSYGSRHRKKKRTLIFE